MVSPLEYGLFGRPLKALKASSHPRAHYWTRRALDTDPETHLYVSFVDG